MMSKGRISHAYIYVIITKHHVCYIDQSHLWKEECGVSISEIERLSTDMQLQSLID